MLFQDSIALLIIRFGIFFHIKHCCNRHYDKEHALKEGCINCNNYLVTGILHKIYEFLILKKI